LEIHGPLLAPTAARLKAIRAGLSVARIALEFATVLAMAASASEVPPLALADLAPTGKLRAGINYGNVILARKDPATGELSGVAIDLSRELARRLGVPLEIMGFESVGAMVDGAKLGSWDIAFLGSDPARETVITFSPAYVELEATYLVASASPLRAAADVDREGVRVAAPARANYELFLSRSLTRAQLVQAPDAGAAFDLLASGKVEALAGLTQALTGLRDKMPGSRLVDGRFMAVQQSVGTPKGRDAGAAYLRGFVEEAKASGLVAQAIEKTGAVGVSVAPKAAAK
jgi:polar amino acid transport system substrate-binding protein